MDQSHQWREKMPDAVEGREAAHGARMIEIQIRFWTDGIAEGKGNIIPKQGWDAGVVKIQRNSAHGIAPGTPVPFNGMPELLSKIEKVLIDQGIKLHRSGRARKWLV